QRLDVVNSNIAQLTAQGTPASDATIASLQAEKDLLQLPQIDTDLAHIPADRIRGMIDDGTVKEYSGDPITIETPWYMPNKTYNTTGYVAIVDIVGDSGYFMILEPY